MLNFRVHGKWILAGEHSVLRGGEALVFPVQSRFLDFSFTPSEQKLSLEIVHLNKDLETAFWEVLKRALEMVDLPLDQLTGRLHLQSQIPIGAGMGASATLCVALARWFHGLGYLQPEDMYPFAKSLEDLFHGESSGVDVAVALSQQPLLFQRPGSMQIFLPNWQPHFYLSYCGKQGVTADCVSQVQSLFIKDKEYAEAIDDKMKEAVALAKESLLDDQKMDNLIGSLDMAQTCFQQWGLITPELRNHMDVLKSLGALAVKPTGSGGGGFVLSLWDYDPQDKPFNFELIQA